MKRFLHIITILLFTLAILFASPNAVLASEEDGEHLEVEVSGYRITLTSLNGWIKGENTIVVTITDEMGMAVRDAEVEILIVRITDGQAASDEHGAGETDEHTESDSDGHGEPETDTHMRTSRNKTPCQIWIRMSQIRNQLKLPPYSFTDFFGLTAPGIDTKGSQYLGVNGTFDLGGGVGIVGHAGWQKLKNGTDIGLIEDSVFDWKLGVTYDIAGSGWIAGAAVVGTSEKDLFLKSDLSEGAGKTSVVVSISKSF